MRIKRFLLSIGLLISVIVTPIPSANALAVKVAPAGWTYLFVSDTPAKQTATPRVFSVNLEKKSNFVPIYNNVPDVAKHNNKQKTMVVNIGEHLKNVNNEMVNIILSKQYQSNNSTNSAESQIQDEIQQTTSPI